MPNNHTIDLARHAASTDPASPDRDSRIEEIWTFYEAQQRQTAQLRSENFELRKRLEAAEEALGTGRADPRDDVPEEQERKRIVDLVQRDLRLSSLTARLEEAQLTAGASTALAERRSREVEILTGIAEALRAKAAGTDMAQRSPEQAEQDLMLAKERIIQHHKNNHARLLELKQLRDQISVLEAKLAKAPAASK
ncbi:hypothetical protein [Wenxinia marina]|nr:hypothetical protein [Wenxinia marina]